MKILILSRSENGHADLVQSYCANWASVDRINFDFDKKPPSDLPMILCGNGTLSEEYEAVFVHHPWIKCNPTWFKDDIEKKLFLASWDSVKEWYEAQLPNATWVNRPSASVQSRNVLKQLRLAQGIGFNVPETLFTNHLESLQVFARDSKVVIKQGNLGISIEGKRILTSLIDVGSIGKEMLQGCPCLFQKYLPKQFELRVHVIGDTVLSCKIDSQKSEKTRIDWRNYDLENTPHEVFELDDDTRKKCVDIVKKLSLSFGIIDMIVTPTGEIVFLECNSQGHWAWIEEMTKLPITKTLCDYILKK